MNCCAVNRAPAGAQWRERLQGWRTAETEHVHHPFAACVAVVLVEQNDELALELARHGYVLETGSIALEADSLMDNEHVRRAYLRI